VSELVREREEGSIGVREGGSKRKREGVLE